MRLRSVQQSKIQSHQPGRTPIQTQSPSTFQPLYGQNLPSQQANIRTTASPSKPAVETYTINVMPPVAGTPPMQAGSQNYQPRTGKQSYNPTKISMANPNIKNNTTSSHTQIQGPQQSTYPLLLDQLLHKNEQLQQNESLIYQLQAQHNESQHQIQNLTDIIKSFYTKGAPLSQTLTSPTFSGSYPTLLQQADTMRQELAQKSQQLERLKMEKGRDMAELVDNRQRVVWYGNRIRDLEGKLQGLYQRIQGEIERGRQGRLGEVQRENGELRGMVKEYEDRNRRILEENKRLSMMLKSATETRPQRQSPPKLIISQPQPQPRQLPPQIVQPQLIQVIQPIQPIQPRPVVSQPPVPKPQPFPPPSLNSSQQQLKQLQQKLSNLRSQNTQLQAEQRRYLTQLKLQKPPIPITEQPQISISILDEKERDPFQLSKSKSTNQTVGEDHTVSFMRPRDRDRKTAIYGVQDIEERIQMLRKENQIYGYGRRK